MGKLGPRLSSKKKTKRWAKGQSASSNPEIQKYRNQARPCFFESNISSDNLNEDILKKHDNFQERKFINNDIDVDESGSSHRCSFRRFDTFANDWSDCSNISFCRFLNHFQTNSAIHTEMLAVIAAVTDVIKLNGGTESSTEYYAALMTTLEAAESKESISAILLLLSIGMKSVPRRILKLKFGYSTQVLLQILIKYTNEDNLFILRNCIDCLSIVLKFQETAVWNNSSSLQILDAILVFTIHSKSKVRKAAQNAICSLLKDSDIMKSDNPPPYHPAAFQVAKYCLTQLGLASQSGQSTCTLHILSMLKSITHKFPKFFVKSLCEELLSIMTLNNVLITSCCLQTFYGLFKMRPTEMVLPPQLNAQIINALFDYQPASGDTQPTLAWLAVVQEAYCNLVLHSEELCVLHISRIIEKCIELWLSVKADIVTGASHTLKTLLETCVCQLSKNEEIMQKYKPLFVKIINLIQQCMKCPYNSVWHHVLNILASLFKIFGPFCEKELANILIFLAELRDSYNFSYNKDIEFAIGAAVRYLGPQVVLNAISLKASSGEIELKRSWLLPVLKDCIDHGSLDYFIKNLLPLAEYCEKKSRALKETDDGIGAHSNELFTSQIWALLPNFCNNPPDIEENFRKIARILGKNISENKNLRLPIMTSLRRLIQKSIDNDNQNNIEELARFARNYLPILFNLYTLKPQGTDEEGQRLACYETIKAYLKITDEHLIGELFDTALENLAKDDETNFFKESIFDLVRILCQFSDTNRVQILYEKCVSLLSTTKQQKEQKKAYRFLEEICKSESPSCQKFVKNNLHDIENVVIKSLVTVQKTSKGPRIRCITHLVKKYPQKIKFIKAIIPEAVICIKEQNEKCRTSSFNLLNTIAEKLMNNKEDFEDFINILISGLKNSSMYCSASILGLSSIIYHHTGSIKNETIYKILDLVSLLIIQSTREITLSALSFVKVYLSVMPTPTIAPTLSKIVQALTIMTEDCERHFRQKVRDIFIKLIRKFGADTIVDMVPKSNIIMQKRLKNIRKIEVKKRKKNEEKIKQIKYVEDFDTKKNFRSLNEILADSDEEFDYSQNEPFNLPTSCNSMKKTWIQENEDNIIDFVDPATVKNIRTTKPANKSNITKIEQKKKKFDFEIAEDGRIIISDDCIDNNDNVAKKKKKECPFVIPDSDNGDKDVPSTMKSMVVKSGLTQKKRKHSTSSNSSTEFTSQYKSGGSGIYRSLKVHKRSIVPGEEYRAKKAFGDIKLKGKPDPFAYIPFKRSELNRRKKSEYSEAFKKILSHSKKNKKHKENSRKKNKKL